MRRTLTWGLLVVVVVVAAPMGQRAAWSQYSAATGAVGATSTTLLQTSKTSTGQDIQYPSVRPQVTALLVEIAPGGQTGRHRHPIPTVAYILEGTLTVAIDGHGEKVFTAGQSLIEAVNTWHNGMNRGTTPVKILAVFVGQKGTPNVVRP
ncbi:MAG TPA: cupin domain-containing protein [bacterium]|nr:cupin domain-containing protein [bacterium]